ncbi:MAG TPA: carboxypeptidase regulatory-like domain-containing protein [archaeon]|nr:carboxypeptidase regulatory-like domain-containing protein [archaeon]
MLEKVKEIYYKFEDKYYEVLDKFEEKFPIYSIVDPIDAVFPSFILLMIIGVLFLLLLFFLVLGGNPLEILISFFSGGSAAKFIVSDSEGTALSGIIVDFLLDGKGESATTDSFGELQTRLFGTGVDVRIKAKDYAEFSDKIDIASGGEYEITLMPAKPAVTVKTINFELRDESRVLLSASDEVTMSFSCSSQGLEPPGFTRNGPRQAVSVQSDCGTLTGTINVPGFEEEKRQVSAALQEGAVIVILKAKNSSASVLATVMDEATGSPIEGASITLRRGDITVLQGSVTDATGASMLFAVPAGTYILQAVAPDYLGYSVGYSNEFSIGAAELSGSSTVEIAVLLQKADSSKMIYLKFVDANSGGPISGVEATLVRMNVAQFPMQSASDGTVKFANLDGNRYSVIASHKDYVLRVVKDANIISSSSSPTIVKLTKAPSGTSGNVKVTVSDYSAAKVANAAVALYSTELVFPVLTGTTDGDGNILFTNLPAGNYYANAGKTVNGVLLDANSETKPLLARQILPLPITLIIANGTAEASVLDEDGKPVKDANVTFKSALNGQVLARKPTNSSGKTDSVELRQDKKPYIVVTKPGYYNYTSLAYEIIPGTKVSIAVVLIRERSPNTLAPFDVELTGVFDSAAKKASKVDENKLYTFKFNFTVLGDLNSASFVARSGLENEINASESNFIIKKFSSFAGDAAYYPCFNPANNYASCGQGQIDFSSSGAKMATKNFSSLSQGVYEISVAAYLLDMPSPSDQNAHIQMRFGVKGQSAASTVFKPDENSLYLWDAVLSKPFCSATDCGFLIEATIQDAAKVLIPVPKKLSDNGPLSSLVKGVVYKVSYQISNLSGERFDNVSLLASKPSDLQNNFLQLSGSSFPVGTLLKSQPAPVAGSFDITAKNIAQKIEVDLNLSAKAKNNSMRLLFSIGDLKTISLSFSPQALEANRSNRLVVKATGSDGNSVQGAFVGIYPAGATDPIRQCSTDSGGFCTFNMPSYQEGTQFDVNASKLGYITASGKISVGAAADAIPDLQCLKAEIAGAKYAVNDAVAEINNRGGSVSFRLLNEGCGAAVEITKIEKLPDSDITLSVNGSLYDFSEHPLFALQNNSSATLAVKSRNVFGLHPLIITAKHGATSYGATARIKIFDPSVCLFADDVLTQTDTKENDFQLDFIKSSEIVRFFNKCYSGQAGQGFPSNTFPLGSKASGVSSEPSVVSPGTSEYRIDVRNTGFSTEEFFLVTTEDYVRSR